MTIAVSDVDFKKSEVVTDTNSNGGRKGQVSVVSGARHSLFPRVTKAERTAGKTRYRKEFWCNEDADDEVAYGVLICLEFPSNGGDRYAIGEGTQIDTVGDFTTSEPDWFGVGALNTTLVGAETEVKLDMESSDFVFPNNGKLHLTDKFKIGQTIDSDVSIGDSVEYSGGTWSKISSTDDIDYPNGLYVGSNVVMTIESGTNEEWIDLKDYEYADEDIGTGDGNDTQPSLTPLLHKVNGICDQSSKLPVVTATCGSVSRTVNVAADGSCSGYCSGGELNMVTGVWTTDITWTTAPDIATDITCTYHENCFLYSGNTVTVYLDDPVANAYSTDDTYGAGCIETDEVTPVSSDWTETSVAGTYDEATYPIILYNDGTEQDDWTITFISATAFTCAGVKSGSVGSGAITSDFEPTNPDTSQPFFKIDKDGWAGTWASGDTVTFTTSPATVSIWWREIVPAGTAALSNNLSVIGYYTE
jgi:hypothetical protein